MTWNFSKHTVNTTPGGAEALKHVAVLIKYLNVYVRAFVGMNNRQHKMHGMHIKIDTFIIILHTGSCARFLKYENEKKAISAS